MQPRKKLTGQIKEVKQNWTGPKNFDICFCVILTTFAKLFSIERSLVTRLCVPTQIWDFPYMLNNPKIVSFKSSGN